MKHNRHIFGEEAKLRLFIKPSGEQLDSFIAQQSSRGFFLFFPFKIYKQRSPISRLQTNHIHEYNNKSSKSKSADNMFTSIISYYCFYNAYTSAIYLFVCCLFMYLLSVLCICQVFTKYVNNRKLFFKIYKILFQRKLIN